jgi:hypothetical protein
MKYFDNFWNDWVNTEYETYSPEIEYIPLYEWVEYLILDGILPHLEKKGYLTYYHKNDIINSILNFIFNLEMTYMKTGRVKYLVPKKNNIGKTEINDEDYFHTYMCHETFWNNLKKKYRIEKYADDGEFSAVLWSELPSYIFLMINIQDSIATDNLRNRLELDDDEVSSEDDTKKKKDIDPYILDYGSRKQKKLEYV